MKMIYIIAVAILFFSTIHAEETHDHLPKLNVTGQATIYKPADQLRMAIGVVSQDKDAQIALQSNNNKMHAVIESLQKNGLKKNEYETAHFSIAPTYSKPPKNPPPDWQATINGYEVKNTINIKTVQMNLAPLLIDEASQAGASSIDSIYFDLSDPQTYQEEAIHKAAAHAISDAESLAKATGIRLVRVLNVSLNNDHPVPMPRMMLAASNVSTPIESGDVEIKARVDLTYEIETVK